MVDWLELVGASLWVVGLAVCLAALSTARYLAHEGDEPVFRRLQQPGLRAALAAGMSLFCIGLLLVSGPWWQRVAWGLMATVFAVWAVRSWRGRQSSTEGER